MSNELAKIEEPSIGGMLQAVIKQGITSENVAALRELCTLYRENQADVARQAFAAAFVALQRDTPRIKATEIVRNNDGTERYKFAPYEKIMPQVQPLLDKHGFGVAFDSDVSEGRITSICTLTHIGGHSKTNRFSVRVSKPPGASEAQADGSTGTYAKRFALCNALNIVIEHDLDGDDARLLGAVITAERAKELRNRVADTDTSEAKFLAFAGATTFEEIFDSKYSELDKFLSKKEAAMR